MTAVRCLNYAEGEGWASYHGDCVEVARQLPSNSVDLALFSPPFAQTYTYSDSPRDMGNVDDEAEFVEGYRFLARELLRITRPGRVCVVHCKQTIRYAGSHGRAGWHDFRGDLIRVHEEEGWQYACEFTLRTDPVVEQRKTNNHRLLYKQLRTDSTFSGPGMPEYLLVFRKWALTDEDKAQVVPVPHARDDFPLGQWQQWAEPVWERLQHTPEHLRWAASLCWMDVNHADTLNVQAARTDNDERHLCPLSLDTIRRPITLYSNPGEVVFSPYGGVGSEGVGALRLGRRAVLVELKESYWRRGVENLRGESGQASLFSAGAAK